MLQKGIYSEKWSRRSRDAGANQHNHERNGECSRNTRFPYEKPRNTTLLLLPERETTNREFSARISWCRAATTRTTQDAEAVVRADSDSHYTFSPHSNQFHMCQSTRCGVGPDEAQVLHKATKVSDGHSEPRVRFALVVSLRRTPLFRARRGCERSDTMRCGGSILPSLRFLQSNCVCV